jgi:hypothetical protein
LSNSFNASNSLNSDWVLIVENIGEDLQVRSTESNNIILEGVCAVFGSKNNNNRVYEKDEYLPHLNYLKDKISKKQLVGDLDHPPHFDVTLKSASHIITGLDYDGGNKVNIKLRILEDTPNGKIAKALINGGVNLSISSRAAGQVLNEGKVKLHRIFTYDLVGEPGFTEAMLKRTVNESLKTDFQMLTESFDHLKSESFVSKNHLTDISESLDYANNFKIYKINNSIESVFENSIQPQKNKNIMAEKFVTADSMNKYSNLVREQINSIKSELKQQKNLFESSNSGIDAVSDSDVNMSKLMGFVNYLAENLEGVVNYADYLSKMVNKSVAYTEHVAKTTNNAIEYTNYLGEKLNTSIGHQDYIAEKVNQTINYAEYIKENLNNSINYQNYLAEQVDQGLQYTEYVAEGANRGIEFAEYLSENININRDYMQYVAERANNGIGYTEYIAEQLNTGNIVPDKRNLLGSVGRVNESAIDSLVNGVDNIIAEVKSTSSKSVLENKYPFLKVMSESNKKRFYKLDTKTKQAIVETLGAAVWFNENDVLGIIESVMNESAKHIPTHIRFMPHDYKPLWNKMNESEQNRIHAKAQLYSINTSYQAKAFWDEQDLRGINERIETEKQNRKLSKLNESQSTEGMIPVERVVEQQRGYTSNYLDNLMRGADYRK